MPIRDRARRAWRRLAEGRRRVWSGKDRTWVELRSVREGDPRLAGLEAAITALPGVQWACFNPYFGRLVVQHRPGLDRAALVDAVIDTERDFGLGQQPFEPDPAPHPGDRSPLTRTAAKAAVNAGSLVLSLGLRSRRVKTTPGEIDLAALTSALENLPEARRWLDRRLGGSTTDLLLTLTSSASQGLAQGVVGQVVDLAQRGLRVREIQAARQAWSAREAELAGQPEQHRTAARHGTQRPGSLPKGPIERYSEKASAASIGGFGFGVASSGRAEQASTSIFGVGPKPARVGREAFAAALGRDLAGRGIVVTHNRPLRRLDRLDTLVVERAVVEPTQGEITAVHVLPRRSRARAQVHAHGLFDPYQPDAEHQDGDWRLLPLERNGRLQGPAAELAEGIVAQRRRPLVLTRRGEVVGLVEVRPLVDAELRETLARAHVLGLRVLVATDEPEPVDWLQPDGVLPQDDALPAALRQLQEDGRGVAYVGAGPSQALAMADLGVGHPREGAPTPWGADLITHGRPQDLALVLRGIELARDASQQSVYAAMAEAAAGLVLSLGSQELASLRRVMGATAVANAAAMANGVRLARFLRDEVQGGRAEPIPWHALEPGEVLARTGSSLEGLSTVEAQHRRDPPAEPPSAISQFGRAVWEEVANPFAPILATGAGLSAAIGSQGDAALVAGAVGLSGLIGGIQRYQTEKAIRALDSAQPTLVTVRRDGHRVEVQDGEVVRGDLLYLVAGDRVPADCRILEAQGLELDESSLTGESVPVRKSAAPSFARAVAERSSMVYADTVVAAGRCAAVAVAVGADAEAHHTRVSRGARAPKTGVEARLQDLTELTAPVAGMTALAMMASGLARGRPPQEIVGSAVSLSVAAVPEGLPLLATVAQLAAARRLSEHGALVRNPRAVEALGRVDVLCADKTGTLTEGRIRLQVVSDAHSPLGLSELPLAHRKVLATALRASPPGTDRRHAHPTDVAVIQGARAAGVTEGEVGGEGGGELRWTRMHEIPFEPARGFHASLGRLDKQLRVCVKGAPEVILPRCDRLRQPDGSTVKLDAVARDRLQQHALEIAGRGLRVLAVAARGARELRDLDDGRVRRLEFRGFLGLADPVRDTARAALDDLRAAGVDVVMITGDHPTTAQAIAAELGLSADQPVRTGPELEGLDDAELDAVVLGATVFARVTPHLKVRIVQSLQRAGRTVAMTGDGANDAPAIRLADVGIALGGRSTAAARGAADVVVTDERIETIVHAVLEGRALWASVRDAVSILVGGNLGEIGFTLLGGLVDGTSPLTTRQIMLVNLLTDALPALSIALRPPADISPEQLMEEGPDSSLGRALDRDIGWRATVTAGSTAAAWTAARLTSSTEQAKGVAFLTLVGSQLAQTMLVGRRSPQVILPALGSGVVLLACTQVPGVAKALGGSPVGPVGLVQAGAAIAGAAVTSAVVPPLVQQARRRALRSERLRRLGRSPPARLITESRLLGRVRKERSS